MTRSGEPVVWFRVLFLIAGLLLAQSALLDHGIEHAFHEHEEACVECLALPGMQALPKQAAGLPPGLALPSELPRAVPPAPTLDRPLAFRSRAPPLRQD